MPDTLTPFPQVRSYCLWAADPEQGRHESQLARIEQWVGDTAVISLPLIETASGHRRVPRAELIDGTGLKVAELKRLDVLSTKSGAFHRGTGKPLTRKEQPEFDLLNDRAAWASLLTALLHRLAAKERRQLLSRAA